MGRPSLIGPGGWTPTDLPAVPRYDPWKRNGEHRLGFVPDSPVATGPGWLLPPNPNHVVGVAGINSSTGNLPIDLTHLGYRPEDITYLSYSGRRDPATRPDDPTRDQRTYDRDDTWQDLHTSALRLRDQLRAHRMRNPGQAVDLVGHSLGGVVVMYYLLVLHDPADPTLPPVDHVATFASPLQGNDLANLLVALRRSDGGHRITDMAGHLLAQDPEAPVIRDLAVWSDAINAIARGWRGARRDVWSSPLASGTQVLTFGASRDPFFVPAHRTGLSGAPHVVLPGGHTDVRATEAARIALHAFLADEPVPGEAGGIGHYYSYGLSLAYLSGAGWAELIGVVDPRTPEGGG